MRISRKHLALVLAPLLLCGGLGAPAAAAAPTCTAPVPSTTQPGYLVADPACETKLSRYNKWQYCWQHEPVHSYVPRGKRKSRNEAA